MKTLKNKQFWYGVLVTVLIITTVAFASRQLRGPTSATTDNAIVRWDGTTAFATKNSGIIITDPATFAYGQSIPNILALGTIGGGGTATLVGTTNICTATFSGTTATVALPSTPSDGVWILHGTTTSTSDQILTIPALVRPESDPEATITTVTNTAVTTSGQFTMAFTAIGGSFVKVSVVGDAL